MRCKWCDLVVEEGLLDVHGRFVVRAQEAHAFFCDLGELEEGDHLEAGGWGLSAVVSFFVVIEWVGKRERTLHCLLTCQSYPVRP